jgi:hypothetical protein
VVEGARLESVYGGNVIAGSNPVLSARLVTLKPPASASCPGVRFVPPWLCCLLRGLFRRLSHRVYPRGGLFTRPCPTLGQSSHDSHRFGQFSGHLDDHDLLGRGRKAQRMCSASPRSEEDIRRKRRSPLPKQPLTPRNTGKEQWCSTS